MVCSYSNPVLVFIDVDPFVVLVFLKATATAGTDICVIIVYRVGPPMDVEEMQDLFEHKVEQCF